MRIDLRYVSSFTYDGPVAQSHNILRARPAESDRQRVLSYSVEVDPVAPVHSSVDYWGTWVDTFAVVREHTRLTVAAEAVVETGPAWVPEAGIEAPVDPFTHHEYLVPSSHVTWNGEVARFATMAVGERTAYADRVQSVVEAVGELLTYTPGATDVGTPVEQILEHRSGVCQDYAHLYATDSARGDEPERDEITVSTHAWVEVPTGTEWWAVDPTNQLPVGERHVKIGHGRDYEDVTPLRGVFHGSSTNAGLEASVAMSRSELPQFDVAPRPKLLTRQADQ